MTTTDDTTTTTDDVVTDDASTGREAARYRVKLREAERERDALAERVSKMQRRQVTGLVSSALADPDDLFDIGRIDLADLLDDDGEVDVVKVETATASLIEGRPRLARAEEPPAYDGGARGTTTRSSATWSGVLGGRP